ncbi:hypothetical protein PFISCL1PPCAC_11575, partial [Pristionchus fissidentatus]
MEAIQATIDNWRRKSSELAVHSNDAVVPTLTKAFEAIEVVLWPQAESVRVEFSLASLASERSLSAQYDAQRNEPIRDLTYDLVDAVHLILGQLSESRHQCTI